MSMLEPETTWENLLSRRREDILGVWELLNADERASVLAHLHRMTEDEGWTEPQRESARAALEVLRAEGEA